MVHNFNFIYIIQLKSFYKENFPVYKIGKFYNFTEIPKDYWLNYYYSCENNEIIEEKIIYLFNKKYIKIKDSFYEGNVKEMAYDIKNIIINTKECIVEDITEIEYKLKKISDEIKNEQENNVYVEIERQRRRKKILCYSK
jgi:hypothetical protein